MSGKRSLLFVITACTVLVIGCGGDDATAPVGNTETGDYLTSLPT